MSEMSIVSANSAALIDGKATAEALRKNIAAEISRLEAENLVPGLAVVLVGEDPASQVYVRNKIRQTKEVGMLSADYKRGADITQAELLELIDTLNKNSDIHGILVQLPLPKHIDEQAVIEAIAPDKDVDGFHPLNSGGLMNGDAGALLPCTPQGCIFLAKEYLGNDLSGKHAVVIGRSDIVGKPVAMLLQQENCTVTVAHSRTNNLPAICSQADILVAAVGRPEMIKADWVKPGATVIHVGINRVDFEGSTKLVGDVAFAEVLQQAGALTPVPGGVGPMAIACLLRNTVIAACRSRGMKSRL